MLKLKEKVLKKCNEVLELKIREIKEAQAAIHESAESESKSTAGDKHETGRAMLQLELEKLGNQLKELEEQKNVLGKINMIPNTGAVAKGSLVHTDKGYLFLGIGLGKIIVNDIAVQAISAQSPLGVKLTGTKPGDKIETNGTGYLVKDIM